MEHFFLQSGFELANFFVSVASVAKCLNSYEKNKIVDHLPPGLPETDFIFHLDNGIGGNLN